MSSGMSFLTMVMVSVKENAGLFICIKLPNLGEIHSYSCENKDTSENVALNPFTIIKVGGVDN